MHSGASHIIRAIGRRWTRAKLGMHALYALSIALPAVVLCRALTDATAWPLLLCYAAALAFVLWIDPSWRARDEELIRFLDSHYPELEESSSLLWQEPQSLSLLQQLQRSRTETSLLHITMPSFGHSYRRPLLSLLVSLTASVLLLWIVSLAMPDRSRTSSYTNHTGIALPAGLQRADLQVVPPGYTRRKTRSQQDLNMQVEEGATVYWRLTLTHPAKRVQFVFNDSLTIPLEAKDGVWTISRTILHPGFYQLRIDTIASELYRIEVTPDQPPVIEIASPKPHTTIDYGEPERVQLRAHVADDYGVRNAVLHTTVAKGSGEAVKFTSQDLSFGISFAAAAQQYDLQKLVALRAMGMEPGDELYFYLSATDNHGQEKRSDIYIVTLADTAKLMSLDGLLNGVNLKPDYFRSQRQIIIETEQLIRDRDTALAENFNNRSNNLGVDQKLLRLRYGKFLGEEASSNDGVSDEHDLGDPSQFGNAGLILDAFTDHHDNAEDATFLDPETKKQLKAVLTEMWSAELQLRLYKPKDALPFEYKALRLLKDLQQKSRAYVAKTSVKTPPIKMEKRLTGKLDKIIEPSKRMRYTVAPDPFAASRDALQMLEQMKSAPVTDPVTLQTLRLAAAQLNERAVREPALYIAALESMRRVLSAQRASIRDITSAQRGLQKMLSTPDARPLQQRAAAPAALRDAYFRNLQKPQQR